MYVCMFQQLSSKFFTVFKVPSANSCISIVHNQPKLLVNVSRDILTLIKGFFLQDNL